jgi:peptidoglycan/LPS O-acetylase OafA/YrhL
VQARRSVGGVHWPELDGLRALAILLVVGRHSLRPFISEDSYAPVAVVGAVDVTTFLLNGWVGVDLFFVLSGFLIGRQAFRGDSWGRFWFKRVTRIVPAYWACLLVVALGLTASGRWGQSLGDFVAHVLMLQDYTGTSFVPAFWSLGAEEKFYLIAPLLALGVTRFESRAAQGLGLVALWAMPIVARAYAAHGLVQPPTYNAYFPAFRSPFHLTCESLVLGFAIAWSSVAIRPAAGRRVREAAFWAGACGLTIAFTRGPLFGHLDWSAIVVMPAAIGLYFGAVVWACVNGSGSYTRVLAWPGWRPLAVGSFTVYLTHMMVIPMAVAAARVGPVGPAADLPRQWLAFLPWYLGFSALSAWTLHVCVERPVLAWRERVLRRPPATSMPAVLPAPRPIQGTIPMLR